MPEIKLSQDKHEYVLNFKHIFESVHEYDLQFDVHHAADSSVIASTLIRADQLDVRNKDSIYSLALLSGELDIGTIDINIVVEPVKSATKHKNKKSTLHGNNSNRSKSNISKSKGFAQTMSNFNPGRNNGTKQGPYPENKENRENRDRRENGAFNPLDQSVDNFMDLKRNLTKYTWSDPMDDEAGPGSYEAESYFGKTVLTKANNPNHSFRSLVNYNRMYTGQALDKVLLLSASPGIIYNPDYQKVQVSASRAVIGKDVRIDYKAMNPYKGRSPGPIYNISKSMIGHGVKIQEDLRWKDEAIRAPSFNAYEPNFKNCERNESATNFTSNHSAWNRTFCKEKERYMTCQGDPAKYNTQNASKDLANKYTVKFSMGSSKRECVEPSLRQQVGPGKYNFSFNTLEKKYGAFGRAERKLDIKKVNHWNHYLLNGKL